MRIPQKQTTNINSIHQKRSSHQPRSSSQHHSSHPHPSPRLPLLLVPLLLISLLILWLLLVVSLLLVRLCDPNEAYQHRLARRNVQNSRWYC